MCNTFDTIPYDASLIPLASHFDCANSVMNRFLKDPVSLQSYHGKTYVLLSDDKSVIIGYYNIGTGYVAQEMDGKKVKIGGAAHINYFALDKRFHHFPAGCQNDKIFYMSDLLLRDCIGRIRQIRENHIGFSFVTLCSTINGYKLYLRNKFYDIDDDMDFAADKTEKDCYLMYYPLDYE